MILLPIVGRELRVASRRTGTYRIRLWAALAGMSLALWKCLDLSWRGGSSASQGRSLFYTLSGLAFFYCLCIGARVTSDCLSEEKREGTFGLLFLTDLGGFDVVLGKLVANSLNSIYGLMAVLPLLAMPLLMGGVTLAEFGRMVLVLLNALFFSLCVGLFVSSLSRHERQAGLATLLGVFVPALLPFCLLFFLVSLEWIQEWADLMTWLPIMALNPIYPYVAMLPLPVFTMARLPDWSFWLSIGAVHTLSWFLLLITSWIVPRIWRDRPKRVAPAAQRISWLERWRTWALGTPEQRRALRVQLLDRNPFLWLVSRDRLKPAYAWFFVGSMVLVWLWGYWQYGDVMFDFYPCVPTVLLIHCFLKVWVVSEVSHRIVDDQRSGAMELLLSTPATVNHVLAGQQMAVLRQFAWPILALTLIELLAFKGSFPVRVIIPVLLTLLADLLTLMWLAMRISWTARSTNEVLVKCLFWVLLAPWVVYLVLLPGYQWFWRSLGFWRFGFVSRVNFWFVTALVTDAALLLVWARPPWVQSARDALARWRAGVGASLTSKPAWRFRTE